MKLQPPLPMLHKLWGVSKPLLAQWCVAKRFDERVEASATIVTINWRIEIYSVCTRIQVALQGLPSYVNKHEYIDKVAEHHLTTAIRPQINAFLEGFNELVSRELISTFNDKELELLINGLPEIDLEDLKANTEYTGYTAASHVVQWFWDVVRAFNKEDMARLLQFITGTQRCLSKVSEHCKVYQVHNDSRFTRHMEHQNGCLLLILAIYTNWKQWCVPADHKWVSDQKKTL